jgi:hypothetical protein
LWQYCIDLICGNVDFSATFLILYAEKYDFIGGNIDFICGNTDFFCGKFYLICGNTDFILRQILFHLRQY